MKRFCLFLIMSVWVLVYANAQFANVRICTEEEIPVNQRKVYKTAAENFLHNYYNTLLLNVNDQVVQSSFIEDFMLGEKQRYKPEFMLRLLPNIQYLLPKQYFQELSKEFLLTEAENLSFDISDIRADETIRATNNIDCFIVVRYTLSLKKEGSILFSRECIAYCYWKQARNYDRVRLMQVEPVKDILPYKSSMIEPEIKESVAVESNSKAKGSRAFDKLYLKAKKGDAIAQFKLGYSYRKGDGVEKNDEKAVYWYKLAAEQGMVNAQYNLGVCYFHGQGVEVDKSTALLWWTKAGYQNDTDAQFYVGLCYEKSEGVEQDYVEALRWYLKAAQKGDVDAQNKVGAYYEYGIGTEKNTAIAFSWYKKAAKQKDAWGQYNVGRCYENGYGTEKNYIKAFKWFKKAVLQEHGLAAYQMGRFYEKGLYKEKNIEKAKISYEFAKLKGVKEAEFALERLKNNDPVDK